MAFGFFNKIKEGLEKTRKSFVKNVETVIIGYAEIDDTALQKCLLTKRMKLHFTIQRLSLLWV